MGFGKKLGATISIPEQNVNYNSIAMNLLNENETCLRLYLVLEEEIPSDVNDRDMGYSDE